MKTRINNHEPPREWLDAALREHFHTVERPSAAYLERCRSAALGALDVLKMQQHREELASQRGALSEHICSLAERAGVKLQAVLQALKIATEADLSAASALGWGQLAQIIGLTRGETVLRVRWGFAKMAGVAEEESWPDAELIRAREQPHPTRKARLLADTLRRAEAGYSAQRRAELRAALSAVARVYEA